MPVPADDIVCRFVRKQDWSSRDQRPKPGAFKQACLSVWHQGRLLAEQIPLDELRIEHLVGTGQSHHSVRDYHEFAREAAEIEGTSFEVRVEWRCGDEYVAEPWRRWRYAHVQVETLVGPSKFLVEFRRMLALRARYNRPPD